MRESRHTNPIGPMLESILTSTFTGGGLEERVEELRAVRGQADGADLEVDRALLQTIARQRAGLLEAREHQKRFREVLSQLTAPPFFPAVFLGLATVGGRRVAHVCLSGQRRIVGLAAELDAGTLVAGDEVVLGHEQNVMLTRLPEPLAAAGETALFERWLADGRAVVRFREEEIVVRLGAALAGVTLERGDPVRWDHAAGLAFEKITRSRGEHHFLERMPDETFAQIGGLDAEIQRIQDLVRLHRDHRSTADRYGVTRARAVLLVGPPGTGKTLLARATANWLGSIAAGGHARFMHVKPGALASMWYGQSEANIREAFRAAREAGEAEPTIPVVMFFDEIDAIGAARGDTLHRVDDRVLQAFMVELNGLEARGNVLVMAATNRLDALDPALIREERLGDLLVPVPRPDRRGALSILGRRLRENVPFAGEDPQRARERALDSVVARLYSANGESLVATLRFRDGRRHEVHARDLMCGASLSRIVRVASERAALREIGGGDPGLVQSDFDRAVDRELVDVVRALTPSSCRRHLEGLPQDGDVVDVQPARPVTARARRYLAGASDAVSRS
jgi:proteasome-associated ATPase